jgi:hypothetical protein
MIWRFSPDDRVAQENGRSRVLIQAVLCASLALALPSVVAAASEPVIKPSPGGASIQVLAAKQGTPAQLALDDGSWEATVTFTGQQFLWFNQFPLGTASFELEEVLVLFPSGAGISAGDAIQIAVWHDPDVDPTNGADLLTSFNSTIQSVDGVTFSVYPVAPAAVTPAGGSLLVGVINRYVVGGIPAATSPAAIDTTSSQGRSWYATWTTDPPPDPPALPSDAATALIDPFEPGNWMIRANGLLGAGSIPSQTPLGIAILVAAIALGGAILLGRRL